MSGFAVALILWNVFYAVFAGAGVVSDAGEMNSDLPSRHVKC